MFHRVREMRMVCIFAWRSLETGEGVAGKRGAIGFLSLCLSTCALGGKERQFIAGTGARLGLPFVVFRTLDKILSP